MYETLTEEQKLNLHSSASELYQATMFLLTGATVINTVTLGGARE
jgi:hypothetical protein